MKLLRFGEVGQEKPGVLDEKGNIRDLSGVIRDLAGDALSAQGLQKLADIDLSSLPLVSGQPRFGIPVAGTVHFIGIGANYADHAAEAGLPIPEEPIVFLKGLGSLSGPTDNIVIPKGSVKTDWEAELAVIIGTAASHVSEQDALDYVAGYAVCNDVSEREWQNEHGPTWDKGKGFATFGPVGPWLVTKDEIKDHQNLDIFLDVDGERKQTGNTRTMIFNVQQLVSYVSRFLPLQPGDIIATGTPPGVGLGHKPKPVFLKAGQIVKLGITGLGEQVHQTVSED